MDDPEFPRAPVVDGSALRAVGVSWAEPMSGPARWFVGCAVVVAGMWCRVFSDPRASLWWTLTAGLATAVLVLVGVVAAATGRDHKPYWLSWRRPGRAVGALVLLSGVTVGLGATRAPLWVRFSQARPALTEMARQPRDSGSRGPAGRAGSYRLRDVFVDGNGFLYFETTSTGVFDSAGFGHYPTGDPDRSGAARRDPDFSYSHLTGPWWVVVATGHP